MEKQYTIKELKKAFWAYIAKTGTVVDNGNIDYVIEQVVKELENDR